VSVCGKVAADQTPRHPARLGRTRRGSDLSGGLADERDIQIQSDALRRWLRETPIPRAAVRRCRADCRSQQITSGRVLRSSRHRSNEKGKDRPDVPLPQTPRAGINDAFSPLHETTDAVWERVIGVNLTGTLKLTRAVLPVMIEAGCGTIVNVASEAALRGTHRVAPTPRPSTPSSA